MRLAAILSSPGATLDAFNRYDPVADAWTTLANMPTAAFMALLLFITRLPIRFTCSVAKMPQAAPIITSPGFTMSRPAHGLLAPICRTPVRSFMASGYNSTNGKIYLVSGYNTGDVSSAQPNTWEYDPVANTFTERAPIPHAIGGAASGIINGHLYVAGGAMRLIQSLIWSGTTTLLVTPGRRKP